MRLSKNEIDSYTHIIGEATQGNCSIKVYEFINNKKHSYFLYVFKGGELLIERYFDSPNKDINIREVREEFLNYQEIYLNQVIQKYFVFNKKE